MVIFKIQRRYINICSTVVKKKTLNTNEKALLSKVHKFLISEICMIQNINENEAEHLLIS
ncbi:hypothetical protein [Caldifermentibacillus hisashii]|uniref:hypothetical protein n=1 Tax=Caldifermentibacillus hisashii TaxID=996558 RepID=UPI0038D0188B